MPENSKKPPSETARKSRYSAERMRALALEDGLRISDRFAREPIYARTGKGTYKGAGVEELQADQAYLESLRKGEDDR